jgi:hypothetical protein
LGVGADEFFKAGAVLLEREMVPLQLCDGIVVVAKLGGCSTGVNDELLEVVAQVGVLLSNDPVLDVGFDGELDGGQVASRTSWSSREQPVGGAEDGGSSKPALNASASCHWSHGSAGYPLHGRRTRFSPIVSQSR